MPRTSNEKQLRSRRRRGPCSLALVVGLSWPICGLAETPPDDVTTAPTKGASAGESTLRATTYKLGSFVINLAGYSYALGTVTGAGMAAAASGAIAWASFIAVDYVWDTYDPANAKMSADQAFDTGEAARRNTLKYLTFKPVALAEKYGVLYLFSGSLATTLTWGTGLTLLTSGFFFANGMAWDWYDWRTMPAAPAPKPAVGVN
jgi:hypothetical protein